MKGNSAGKPIVLQPIGLKGVSKGWANELIGGEAAMDIRVWDKMEGRYFDFSVNPRELGVDKSDPKLMAQGDWERVYCYSMNCMELALMTHDVKWAKRLHKLGKLAELKINAMKAGQIVPVKKERVRKPFGKGEGLMVDVPKIGSTVRDTRRRETGIVVGKGKVFKEMVRVCFYNPRLNKHIVKERRPDLLEVVEDATALDPQTEEFKDLYVRTAAILAVDTKDCNWFNEIHGKKQGLQEH